MDSNLNIIMNYKKAFFFLIFSLLYSRIVFSQNTNIQYKPVIFDFKVEATNETSSINPFTDYRLNVTFFHDNYQYKVPGFYAADGNAANTGAESGGIWRVIFTPPYSGEWTYSVSFTKEKNIAIENDPYVGIPIKAHHGSTGIFTVNPPDKNAEHFERSGAVIYNNSRYLYTQNGEPILLFGTNSPENFLAYQDFDNTYSSDPDKNFLKSWSPHINDWKKGDPIWKDGKGKGIIGALNYLASKNMNVLYLLTLNIDGDAKDVWPFISHHRKDFKRYDVSKLAQWDIVFSHAEKLGIVIEVITSEQENQLLLDDGYTLSERKLYFRELIARFSYHKNIIWNIGEENGFTDSWPHGQNDQQRYSMIRYIKENDPYKHPVLMHTYPFEEEREAITTPLLKFKLFNGLSMQVGDPIHVHGDIKKWVEKSEEINPWIILMDEIGPWHTGTQPDDLNADHLMERTNVLWPALMAGAAGVQWYFGWLTPPHDLNAQDLRSRNNIWEQSAYAKELFAQINFSKMNSSDYLISKGQNYCFSNTGSTYVIYLKYGGTTSLDLRNVEGEYSIEWFNPRQGGKLIKGTKEKIISGGWENIGLAPEDKFKDWVVLIRRE